MPTQIKGMTAGSNLDWKFSDPYGEWGGFANGETSNDLDVGGAIENDLYFSQILIATGYNFDIPAWATIDGVDVVVERAADVADAVQDAVVQLVLNGTRTGNDKKNTSVKWPTSDANASYGGPADKWGNTLTPQIVNSNDFGLAIAGEFIESYSVPLQDVFLTIDLISIEITYTDATCGGYIDGDITRCYYGSSDVRKIYHGSNLIAGQ